MSSTISKKKILEITARKHGVGHYTPPPAPEAKPIPLTSHQRIERLEGEVSEINEALDPEEIAQDVLIQISEQL
ncbi:MAG: hypothetical protein IH948_07390 [Bacteroidetes bacterium]|nr:hypothetical protein [Bacteroidota bacterium]